MASIQLTTMVLFFLFIGINGLCGQLGPNFIPLMTNSSRARHWPWHAAIYHREYGSIDTYQCGGTVISSDSILTAAHCVSRNNEVMFSGDVSVSLGRLNLNASESSAQKFDAANIIIHPSYSEIDYSNDIAIIRLSSNVTFNIYVQPICLWKSIEINISKIVGRAGTVVGWGKTETGYMSNVLRQASLPVVDSITCLESNRHFVGSVLSRKNFCAGIRNGTSVCNGDSGGSMTFEENGTYSIRGIVSVGPAAKDHTTQTITCNSMEYVIFTDVAQYLPWIRDHLEFECEEKFRCGWFMQPTICALFMNATIQRCKIIVDETSNPNVIELYVYGPLEVFSNLSDGVTIFENLRRLTFATELQVLQRDQLTAFGRIAELYFWHNRVTQFAAGTFDDLKNLTLLSIQGQLKEVHVDLFKELRNLEVLSLYSNQIENLPVGLLRNNKKLISLKLGSNKFSSINADIFAGLSNLEELFLLRNQITHLAANSFDELENLRDLRIFDNQLRELHVDLFKELRNLEELSLENNLLEILTAEHFRNNNKLKTIGLRGNKIRKLEFDFANFPNLKEFDLSGNVCINETCFDCNESSFTTLREKIKQNC